MDKEEKAQDTLVMHDFQRADLTGIFSRKFIGFLLIIAVLGVGTGYLLSRNSQQGGTSSLINSNGGSVGKGTVVGSNDSKTFKDQAVGKLEKGGIEDEGQYHLVRPGGESQYVYLTSSVIDLSKFIGKKLKVWGETQKAQKAGWLMDVGKVEVLE